MDHTVIAAHDLCKSYRIYQNKREKWMDILLPGQWGTEFSALKNISFQVRAGEALGLVGRNGSGKSTLSNLIAGTSQPTSGTLRTEGIAAMIAVSVGLNLQMTGLENIELKGLLIGLSRREIRELMPRIVDFADLGGFIDQPVKIYSSGMRARLAFAISINIDPDILVIDEGFTVGDATFVDRCLDRIHQFRANGKTMVFTSHSAGQIRDFCDRLLWLEAGELMMDGSVPEVMGEYERFLRWFQKSSPAVQKRYEMDRQRERMRRAGRSASSP